MSQNNHYDLTDGTNSKKRLYKKGAVNKTDVLFTAFFDFSELNINWFTKKIQGRNRPWIFAQFVKEKSSE